MHLIKEKNKIYILVTNSEQVSEHEERFRGDMHISNYLKEGKVTYFQGKQGAFQLLVEEINLVNRVLPHDTTARSYWGEFNRKYRLEPRLSKLVHKDVDYIVKCSFYDPEANRKFDEHIKGSYEFNSFVPCEYDEWNFHGVLAKREHRNKTWNLTIDRFLGPNLSDYSTNDCYKYYVLL